MTLVEDRAPRTPPEHHLEGPLSTIVAVDVFRWAFGAAPVEDRDADPFWKAYLEGPSSRIVAPPEGDLERPLSSRSSPNPAGAHLYNPHAVRGWDDSTEALADAPKTLRTLADALADASQNNPITASHPVARHSADGALHFVA